MKRSTADSDAWPTPLEALLDRAARTPEAIALVAKGESWSSARLASESARLADAFSHYGIRAGDRVALHMFNRTELVLAYFACWRTGAIAVPLNSRLKAPELAAMFARVRPALYLGEADLYDGITGVGEEVLAPSARFVVGLDKARNSAEPWAELMAAGAGRASDRSPPPVTVDRNAPAVLLSTSGTTGPSKLVVWTSKTLAAFKPGAAAYGLKAVNTLVLSTPMMHASGVYFLSACLLTGAKAILLRAFDPDAVLDAVEAHEATTFFGMPSSSAELAKHQRARPRRVNSLHHCYVTGDVCSAETTQAFEDTFGMPLLAGWGSTECAGSMRAGTKPGPFMRPFPTTEVRVIDEDGRPVPDGDQGEMLLRAPVMASGYWLGPGRIDPFPAGWFRTGDLVRREPDGQLRYIGRTKDLIVRGGSNISLVEVETVLERQPGVKDAAVAGLPDPELGERVGAALVLEAGMTEASVPEILAGVRRELADYKVPEAVAIVEAIPRNALTKLDRRAVAEMIERQTAN